MPTHDNMSQVWLNVNSLSEIQTIDSNEDYIAYRSLRNLSHYHLQNIQNFTHLDHHIPPTYSFSCCISSLPFISAFNIVVYYFFMYPFCVALKLDLPTWSAKLQPLVEIHIQQKVGLVRRVF